MRPYEVYQLMLQKQANMVDEFMHTASHIAGHEISGHQSKPRKSPKIKRLEVKSAHALYLITTKAANTVPSGQGQFLNGYWKGLMAGGRSNRSDTRAPRT